MTSTSNNTAQRDYIKVQLTAFLERIGDEGTWNKSEALVELGDWIDSATFKIPRKTRTTAVVAAEERCVARTWAGGLGGQCKKAKCVGSFCKNCAKKEACCSVAASFNQDGTHKGLFWGRTDEDLPIEAADGKGVAIMWKDEDTKSQIREILSDGGQWHPFCTASSEGYRTGDWDAAPITTMNSRKSKKTASKKSKKKKTKRTKNAYLFFMGEKRGDITSNLRSFVNDTKMDPILAIHFLTENNNDLAASIKAFKKLAKKAPFMKKKLIALDIEGDGKIADDFVFKGKYAMGPIGKLGGALWGKMTDTEKKPFNDMATEAKAVMAAASADESDTEMSDHELEASEVDEGENSDDDEIEISDITLEDGTDIMVDDDGVIYSDDGEKIGTYDSETKKASYYTDDDEQSEEADDADEEE